MLTLPTLPNIHLRRAQAEQVAPPPSPASEPSSVDAGGQLRKVTRSPAEELAARAARWGQTEQVPDSLLAMICAEARSIQVAPNGITFNFENKTYRFWAPESLACHPTNVGKTISFVFTRHDLTRIYIVDDAGRYTETLPLANSPAFFDAAMEKERAATQRVINHVHRSLKETHRLTTAQDNVANLENREKLQYADSYIVRGVQAEAPASIPHADDINNRMRKVEANRAEERAAQARASEIDVVEFTNRRAARARKREAAEAVPAFDRA